MHPWLGHGKESLECSWDAAELGVSGVDSDRPGSIVGKGLSEWGGLSRTRYWSMDVSPAALNRTGSMLKWRSPCSFSGTLDKVRGSDRVLEVHGEGKQGWWWQWQWQAGSRGGSIVSSEWGGGVVDATISLRCRICQGLRLYIIAEYFEQSNGKVSWGGCFNEIQIDTYRGLESFQRLWVLWMKGGRWEAGQIRALGLMLATTQIDSSYMASIFHRDSLLSVICISESIVSS